MQEIREEKGTGVKIVFWKIAGMGGKDKEFWESLKVWDVIVLSKIWIEKNTWESIKDRLPEGYKWKMQEAKREYKRGRTKGDMILEVLKRI